MILNNSIILSKPNGGAFGFVPDWSKMVAITAPYTVPADGYISAGGSQKGLDGSPLVVDGMRVASASVAGGYENGTETNWRLLPCFKGQTVSSVTVYCYFVPLSRVALKAPNASNSVDFASGSATTSNGYIYSEDLSYTSASSVQPTINGNVVARNELYSMSGTKKGNYWFFAPVLKGTTFSGSGTIKFIPFKL